MEQEIMCKTCGFALHKHTNRGGIVPYNSPVCVRYDGAPDPVTHKENTKPKEVLEGAECFHYITEEEYQKRHQPNYDGN